MQKPPADGDRPRILVVDDDPQVQQLLIHNLTKHGFEVTAASDGLAAIGILGRAPHDVVITDLRMPGMDGMSLLRCIREQDIDIPVLVLTGSPDMQSAIRAIEYGVFRYLTKPVPTPQLIEAVSRAASLGRYSRLRREAHDLLGKEGFAVGDRAGLEVSFKQALEGLYMAFQPIVDVPNNRVYAYEALMRSGGGVLKSPLDILGAAEKLRRLPELARLIRHRVAGSVPALPADTFLFVNLHPMDLADPELLTFDNPLSAHASRIVLEITERASFDDVPDARRRLESLRTIGYRLALDDLGAGYAGLNSFATMNPDVVKLDMALIQGVDRSPRQAKLITSLVQLCRDLGSRVIAEGVETEAEKETLVTCGCDLLQGYLLGRPDREFLTWPR